MKTTRLAVLIVAGAAVWTSGQILADQDVRHGIFLSLRL